MWRRGRLCECLGGGGLLVSMEEGEAVLVLPRGRRHQGIEGGVDFMGDGEVAGWAEDARLS